VKILPPPFRPLRGPYRADRGRFAVGRPERQVRAVNPPRRPPEPPPEGGPPAGPPKVRSPASPGARIAWPLRGRASPEVLPTSKAQGLLTPLTWRSEHVTLRGPRSPRRGQRPTPPRGSFTSLTWRSDHVTPRGGYPRKNPPGKATGRPAQGPFTPPTWRSDDGTPWGRRAGG